MSALDLALGIVLGVVGLVALIVVGRWAVPFCSAIADLMRSMEP